jgi:hypothetical protein
MATLITPDEVPQQAIPFINRVVERWAQMPDARRLDWYHEAPVWLVFWPGETGGEQAQFQLSVVREGAELYASMSIDFFWINDGDGTMQLRRERPNASRGKVRLSDLESFKVDEDMQVRLNSAPVDPDRSSPDWDVVPMSRFAVKGGRF